MNAEMNADEIVREARELTSFDIEESPCATKSKINALCAALESLQARLAQITAKPELTSPVRYYTDGKPYVQIGGLELHDHPVTEACARLDRYEKHIIPHLQTQLSASQRRERATTCGSCAFKGTVGCHCAKAPWRGLKAGGRTE